MGSKPTPEQKAQYAAAARARRAADPMRYRTKRTPEQKAAYAAAKRADRAADPEKYRARDRERLQNPVRRAQRRESSIRNVDTKKAYNQRYYAENSERFRAMVDAWRAAHPERVAAHRAVKKAVRNGVLVRPDACEECGVSCHPDGAHTDYSRPLDVLWLCRRCHMIMDKGKMDDEQASAASGC